MNLRSVNLVLLGVVLGLAAYVVYLRARPVPVSVVTDTLWVTNIVGRKGPLTNYLGDYLSLAALLKRPTGWNELESTNYTAYITNLRSFGCPEETIRDIIIADVAKLFAQRRAELRAQLPGRRYWQPLDAGQGPSADEQDLRQQLQDLDTDERNLLRELLGVDLQTELAKYSTGEPLPQARYGYLPEDKRGPVTGLVKKYAELEDEVRARSGGLLLPEDKAELQRLQKARETELAKVLTPEELDAYQLRESPTAQQLRAQLQGFNPSEAEFRKLFQAQKSFDDTFTSPLEPDSEKDAAIRARAEREAQKALNDEIKKTLGETRYAEYQRAQDNDYRTLTKLAERFDLPADVAGKVYDMKVAVEQQKQRIRENPNLTDDQRLAALLAIRIKTESELKRTLPSAVLKDYRSVGGKWVTDWNVAPVEENELNY